MSHIVADTTPLYTVLHYSTILMCRLDRAIHSQAAKLTGCQYLVVKVEFAIKKTSQSNKMWLEWFPCFALLNYPIQYYRELTSLGESYIY